MTYQVLDHVFTFYTWIVCVLPMFWCFGVYFFLPFDSGFGSNLFATSRSAALTSEVRYTVYHTSAHSLGARWFGI